MAQDLQLEFVLPAGFEQVMRLLTEPAQLRRWSGAEALMEAREGAAFELLDGWATGTVTQLAKDRLSLSWQTADWAAGAPASAVDIQLKKGSSETIVLLRHSALPGADEAEAYKRFWDEDFFGLLEEYLWSMKSFEK